MKHLKLLVIGVLLVAAMLPLELLARSYMTVHLGGEPANFDCGRVAITFPLEGESYSMKIAGDWGSRSYTTSDIRGVTFTSDGLDVRNDRVETVAPLGFAIFGNYPNPFNGGTTIRYKVDHAGRVKVRVCDLSGRVVASLVDTLQPAGNYSVRWDGVSESGGSVPAGIYFCEFGVGERIEARWMLLVR